MFESKKGAAVPTGRPDENVMASIREALEALGQGPSWGNLSLEKVATASHLSDKRILIVDKSAAMLAELIPSLMVATNGKVAFHHLQNGDAFRQAYEVEAKVRSFKPDIILLDFDFGTVSRGGGARNGAIFARDLKSSFPYLLILGISSDPEVIKLTEKSGAHGSIDRTLLASRAGIEAIAEKAQTHEPFKVKERLVKQGHVVFHNGLILEPEINGMRRYSNELTAESLFNANIRGYSLDQAIEKLSSFVEWNDSPEAGNLLRTTGNAKEVYGEYLRKQVEHIESPFLKYVHLIGDVTYLNHVHRIPLAIKGNQKIDCTIARLSMLSQLTTCVPWQLQMNPIGEVCAAAANGENFAFLMEAYGDSSKERRIITGESLYELQDVSGYDYLAISEDGKPFHRCKTSRHGGRAFFDGDRLMAHEMFTTCMPDVVFFEGGYMVNSSECTIINGILYPLINRSDVTAIPGQELRGGSRREAYLSNVEVANRLVISADGVVSLDGGTIKPIGIFRPSSTSLRDNGFTHYEWSEFVEL